MKKVVLITSFAIAAILVSCGGGEKKSTESADNKSAETKEQPKTSGANPDSYDPKRGEGKWTADMLGLKDKLDTKMAKEGDNLAGVKCFSCHKVTDEKLVGPGWKGVTKRRTPEWIMNFITNPDPMLDKDPEAQSMLEICLVRMPNQNLTDDEARHILEYMRENDGIK
ncbi:MAG: c-type cytochrome [Bacteroidetes bacterium]|nr:c-type cytochrome [Bacteroidota bacterium]